MPGSLPDYGTCPRCGATMFPVLRQSPCGHSEEPDVEPLDVAGTVYSWTVVHTGDTPTTMVMADFEDQGLRVTAPLVGGSGVEIGSKVRLVTTEATPYALILAG